MKEAEAIKCLVVDDEPAARDVIKRYIAQVPMLQLAGECAHAVAAMDFLQRQPVDLLFLDIRMPQLNGTELVKILRHPPRIIFTTAHAEYALEGFELDAVDYLLKPIPFDRFLKAAQKALHRPLATTADAAPAPLPPGKEAFVYFRADRKMVKVLLKDILYVESMKDYVKVFTTEGLIITKQSLSALEEMLPEQDFVRTHRSFLVSLQQVRSFTTELIDIGKAEVPIGKLYRQSVLKMLG